MKRGVSNGLIFCRRNGHLYFYISSLKIGISLNRKGREDVRKSVLRTSVSVLLCVAVIFSLSCSAMAQTNPQSQSAQAIQATNALIESKDFDIVAANTKTLYDFSGNPYTLVECIPTGYYILSNNSGVYSEYSETSPSPYAGYNTELYYGGPTYYYVKDGDEFHHTLFQSEVLTSVESLEMQQYCEQMNSVLLSKQSDVSLATSNTNSLSPMGSSIPEVYVPNSSFFSTYLTGFGYKETAAGEGLCGYIAANLVLQYWQSRDEFTLPYSSSEISCGELTDDLYVVGQDLGYSNSTVAWEISNVLNTFCQSKNLPQVAAWGIGNYGVTSEIDTGRPSILFGNLLTPYGTYSNHAVVAYGYEDVPNGRFIVHFGWNNYAKVYVDEGILGSNTCYRIT